MDLFLILLPVSFFQNFGVWRFLCNSFEMAVANVVYVLQRNLGFSCSSISHVMYGSRGLRMSETSKH